MSTTNGTGGEKKLTWQAQKSSFTRDRIILATLDCIVEVGYAQSTMARIAEKAGVSQGSMQHHFSAKIELVIAARTDPGLGAVMRPAYQTFERMWRQYSLDLESEWRGAKDRFDLLSNVGQYLMEGMAFGYLNRQLDDKDVEELLDYTKSRLRQILRDAASTAR